MASFFRLEGGGYFDHLNSNMERPAPQKRRRFKQMNAGARRRMASPLRLRVPWVSHVAKPSTFSTKLS